MADTCTVLRLLARPVTVEQTEQPPTDSSDRAETLPAAEE